MGAYTLRKDSTGQLVVTLKGWLNQVIDPSPKLGSDSHFDQKTFDAVVRFQAQHRLKPDGRVGPNTWGEIGKEIGRRDLKLQFISALPLWLKNLVTGKKQVKGAMAFSPSIFLGMYMEEYGGLNESQVAGLETLLAAVEMDPDVTDVRWAAYMLATTQHECSDSSGRPTWQPIEEDPGSRAGRDYNNPVKVKGENGKEYDIIYYGRGYVQLTWKDNYEKMSKALNMGDALLIHPERVMEPKIAYRIMSYGMRNGSFRHNLKLSDFINSSKCDYKNARGIINGDVATWGDVIAGYARKLETFLQASLQ